MKSFFKLLMVFGIGLLPLLGFADGTHTPGTVSVNTSPNGFALAQGSLNVRYNPAVATGSIGAQYNAGNSIAFFAQDSTTNESFSCVIVASHPLYAAAEKVMQSMGPGAYVSLTKQAASSNCASFYLVMSSQYQD